MENASQYARRPHFRDYALVSFLFLSLVILAPPRISSPALNVPADAPSVSIAGRTIMIEIVRTSEEFARGLSGHAPLAENEGMLFLFDQPDRYSFWMPDMRFAIDIIWIGSDWRIVDISHNVTPESYPEVFTPSAPAQYVLEVPADSAERYGWKVGEEAFLDR